MVIICVSKVNSLAQTRKTVYDNQVWFQYFMNARLSEKWSAYFDGGYRTTDWNKSRQYLLRTAATYHLNSKHTIQAGFAYFVTYARSGSNILPVPELRPWQRYNVTSTLGRAIVIQRYRLEERFFHKYKGAELTDGYKFNFRASYHLGFAVPLNKKTLEKGTVFLQASNELFINFGSGIVYNIFDQYRIFGGLGYQFTKEIGCLAGYQHVWQQGSDGLTMNDNSCVRLSIIHNLDFRSKE